MAVCLHPIRFFYCGSLFCSRVKARYGGGFRCLKWNRCGTEMLASPESLPGQNGGKSPQLLAVPHPSQPGAAPALREGSCSAHCGGTPFPKPACPEVGRLLSLTCHPHVQTEPGRSPRFSWRILGEGLSQGNGRFACETFSSLAGGYTPASPTSQEASPARRLLVLPRCPPLWQQGSSSFCRGEISFGGGGRPGVSNSCCLMCFLRWLSSAKCIDASWASN